MGGWPPDSRASSPPFPLPLNKGTHHRRHNDTISCSRSSNSVRHWATNSLTLATSALVRFAISALALSTDPSVNLQSNSTRRPQGHNERQGLKGTKEKSKKGGQSGCGWCVGASPPMMLQCRGAKSPCAFMLWNLSCAIKTGGFFSFSGAA